jgi:AFG3 family protein
MLRAPLPSSPLPGGESGGLGLARRYLTSALVSRAAAANGAGKARDWKTLLANSQSRRLMCDQSKKSKLFLCGFWWSFHPLTGSVNNVAP